jgi:hypothetical protein
MRIAQEVTPAVIFILRLVGERYRCLDATKPGQIFESFMLVQFPLTSLLLFFRHLDCCLVAQMSVLDTSKRSSRHPLIVMLPFGQWLRLAAYSEQMPFLLRVA